MGYAGMSSFQRQRVRSRLFVERDSLRRAACRGCYIHASHGYQKCPLVCQTAIKIRDLDEQITNTL